MKSPNCQLAGHNPDSLRAKFKSSHVPFFWYILSVLLSLAYDTMVNFLFGTAPPNNLLSLIIMSWLDVILLAIVEGLTEFLPVSSTGHMILLSSLLQIESEKFTKDFEIIIQFGAILSVLALYSKQILKNPILIPKIVIAFLPTAIIGFVLKDHVDKLLESPWVVVCSLFLGGIVLTFADRWFAQQKTAGKQIEDLRNHQLLLIGLIQCVALVPGVSRSAATILAGIFMGLSFQESAKFSFLLALPTLGGAAFLRALKMDTASLASLLPQLLVGGAIAFVICYLTMTFLLRFLATHGFRAFGWYRIVVSVVMAGILLQMG